MALVYETQITQIETDHDSYYLEQIIELPSSVIPQFDLVMLYSDMAYFIANKPKFINDPNLKGKYIAIHNHKIIGKGDDDIELTKRMYEEHGYIPILIQKVEEEIIYRIYSPHIG